MQPIRLLSIPENVNVEIINNPSKRLGWIGKESGTVQNRVGMNDPVILRKLEGKIYVLIG